MLDEIDLEAERQGNAIKRLNSLSIHKSTTRKRAGGARIATRKNKDTKGNHGKRIKIDRS